MYSFNFDYIFNFVYNIFLAIRYAILFWILGIDKNLYLMDHKDDAFDGLRDRGWININQNQTITYLGNGDINNYSSKLSWWDSIKDNIFGIDKKNINFVVEKTNNDSLFSNLKFSIQNPVLSFFADIISVLTFFVLLLFIYSFLKWLYSVIPKKETLKDDVIDENYGNQKTLLNSQDVKIIIEKENKKISELNENNIKEENIKKEEKLEDSIPGGIFGLPIDIHDLNKEELKEIENKENLLLDYKIKNIEHIKENQILKVKKHSLNYSSREEVEDRKYKIFELEKIKQYKNRWNIVVGYMEGSEEALWRIGILEADNLLNELLTDKGYFGLTLSDKLKKANFNNIDLAWSAHKIRNRIAHDGSKFVLTYRMAKNTLELYRAIFSEFKLFE